MLSGWCGGLLFGVLGWLVDPDGLGDVEDLRGVGGREAVWVPGTGVGQDGPPVGGFGGGQPAVHIGWGVQSDEQLAFGVLGLAHPVPHRIERIKPLRSRTISRVRCSFFGEDLAALAGGNQSVRDGAGEIVLGEIPSVCQRQPDRLAQRGALRLRCVKGLVPSS